MNHRAMRYYKIIVFSSVLGFHLSCNIGSDINDEKKEDFEFTLVQSFEANISLNNIHVIKGNRKSWAAGDRAKVDNPPNFSTEAILLKTDDLWETYDIQVLSINNPMGMYFLDSDNGWIVGNEGIILKTEDGGDTWEQRYSGTGLDLWSIWFKDSLHGVIRGGITLRTDDGGNSWYEDTETYYSGKTFIDDTTGFGMIGSKLYKTEDGGVTWNLLYNFLNPKVYSFQTVDGVNFLGSGDLLMESNNSGTEWKIMDYEIKGSLWFLNGMEGRVIWGNIIWLTFDGGETWEKESIPNISFTSDIEYIGSRDIWVCGQNSILHYERK